MRDDELEGWYTDPFDRHEARWMSRGTPTSLVRDGQAESIDPVSDEPFTVTPLRITYAEQEPGADSDRFFKSNGGIVVPGGVVTIEPHLTSNEHLAVAKIALQSTTGLGALRVQRDIVVWDAAHEHQLYRDGPYNSITRQPSA